MKRNRKISLGIAIATFWLYPFSVSAEPDSESLLSIDVDGRERSYLVHLPPAGKRQQPLPVVLAFHGGGGSAERFAVWTGLSEKADREGFIVVYPNGTGRGRIRTWNAGTCCGYAQENKVDDVKFVSLMLDDLQVRYQIDRHRIYATGMSNGAMFTYRIAQQLSDRIAAIAPVGATMGTDTRPSRPVPVAHFHGTADQHAAYEGGAGPSAVTDTDFMSVSDCIAWWAAVNGCHDPPEVQTLPDTAEDEMRVRRDRYPPQEGGAEVVLYSIEGGGHTWPGRPPVAENTPRWLKNSRFVQGLGAATRDISANDLMWEFFRRNPLPDPLDP